MKLFKILAVYFSFISICFIVEGQNIQSKTSTNATKLSGNKLVEDDGNVQTKGPGSLPENKPASQSNPTLPITIQNIAPQSKSTQKPLNFVIPKNPCTIPTKIPLVFKIPKVCPAPAHYARLKADPDKNKRLKLKAEVKKDPTKKVTPKDKVTPKTGLSLARENKLKQQSSRKPKPKRIKFFEDDTNIKSLPSGPAQTKQRKNKKPESKKETPKDIISETNENEQKTTVVTGKDSNDNDIIRIENGTHSILITKLDPRFTNRNSTKMLKKVKEGPPTTVTADIPIEPSASKPEEVQDILPIMEYVAAKTEPIFRELPVVNSTRDESPPDITIIDHNYEEVEERTGAPLHERPIANEDIAQQWPVAQQSLDEPQQPLNSQPTNPYNDIYRNYQEMYNKYLKSIAEINPTLFSKGNCYPRANLPDPNELGTIEEYVTPTTAQVQDVYYGQNQETQSNVINIRPENALGRIWRTWKDTEIKISKPNVNKPPEIAKNLNDLSYGEVLGKAPTPYENRAIGLNGYYNNLNNALAYQNPSYRYML